MAWLVGIIVLILAVVFWRASLIILGIGAVLVFLIVQNVQEQNDRSARQRAAEAERARTVVAEAQRRVRDAQQAPVPKEWRVTTERDPASGQQIPRGASVESDDGLCTMTVEERIDRTKLTGFSCPGLQIRVDSYDAKVEIKFDNRNTSDFMEISRFSNSSTSAYIPHYQEYGKLKYEDLLGRFASASKVAIRVPFTHAGDQWISFSLNGSRGSLAAIGAL